MPIKIIETKRLYKQIAEQLKELIASGEFPPGSRLPAERDLAAKLGVSRVSLREALVALEVWGLIDVRLSSGIYVTADKISSPAATPTLENVPEAPPLDLAQTRWYVEGETAGLAAINATEKQMDEMQTYINDLQASLKGWIPRHPADRGFHIKVAEASGNMSLLHVVTFLQDQQLSAGYQKLEEHFTTFKMWEFAVRDHQAVLNSIRDRNARRAKRQMRKHLERIYGTLVFSSHMAGVTQP